MTAKASASPGSFEQAVEESHRALDEIARGNLDAFMALYTDREDATVGNPFGPPARGRDEIEQAGQRAAANYRDGRAVEFENVPPTYFATSDTRSRSNGSKPRSPEPTI